MDSLLEKKIENPRMSLEGKLGGVKNSFSSSLNEGMAVQLFFVNVKFRIELILDKSLNT